MKIDDLEEENIKDVIKGDNLRVSQECCLRMNRMSSERIKYPEKGGSGGAQRLPQARKER
jgi:hypothetical protein